MRADFAALALVAFLLTYAIHSTVLLGAAWLAARRLPARAGPLRERIWKLALLGGFVTAALQVGLGLEPPLGRWSLPEGERAIETLAPSGAAADPHALASPLPFDPSAQRATRRTSPAAPAALGSRALPERTPVPGDGAPVIPNEVMLLEAGPVAADLPRVASLPRQLADASERPSEGRTVRRRWRELPIAAEIAPATVRLEANAAPSASARPSPPSRDRARDRLAAADWLRLAASAWVLALALVVVGFARAWRQLGRGLRDRREIVSGPLLEMLAGAARKAGFEHEVRLWIAPRLSAPLSFGVFRRSICIPPRALCELTPDEQESMLAHELAHLVRRDPLWRCVAWLIEALFFFQPLNRVARRELHEVSELLCDDWAVRTTGRRLALASCLARIAGWIVGEPRALLAAHLTTGEGSGARACSRLGRRIERLLDERAEALADSPRSWFKACAAASLGTLALVVPGVSAQPGKSASELPTAPRFPFDAAEHSVPDSRGGPKGGAVLDDTQDDAEVEAENGIGDDPDRPAPPAAPSRTARPETPLPICTESVASPCGEADAPPAHDSSTRELPGERPSPTALASDAALVSEVAALDEALSLLQSEIGSLELELEELGLADRFDEGLARLRQRAQALDGRRRRMKELLVTTLLREADSTGAAEPRLEDRPVR